MFEFPKILAWELTRRCPLRCRHCRMEQNAAGGELTTEEALRAARSFGGVKLAILTGGEPMMRNDLCALAREASAAGARCVLATCGMLADERKMRELMASGVNACSFSIDAPDETAHDRYRGVTGAFNCTLQAMALCRRIGMPFQVNTVAAKSTIARLDDMVALAKREGAMRLDVFFLVPTGHAAAMEGEVPSIAEMDETRKIMAKYGDFVHFTCHPAGCIGGRGFAFLSAEGDLRMCGFTPGTFGNIRRFDCSLPATVSAAQPPLSASCRSPSHSA
ncbi:MAG: radical SAM protein [Kiritimatiellae bacterium]|nr:radical SAM protein [Kiritimatiellia bacterium]